MRQNLLFLATGLLFGFLLCLGTCRGPKPCPCAGALVKVDSTVTVDTTGYDFLPLQGGRIPDVIQAVSVQMLPVPVRPGQSVPADQLPCLSDSDKLIIQQFYTEQQFNQRVKLANGVARASFKIARGQVSDIGVTVDSLQYPITTKTVTVRERCLTPAKIKGYFTLCAQGSPQDLLRAGGPGFMLQFKNDDALEAAALYDFTLRAPIYQVSYKRKISFHL